MIPDKENENRHRIFDVLIMGEGFGHLSSRCICFSKIMMMRLFPARNFKITKRQWGILAAVSLAAMILAVYWPVQNYDFINYDDFGYVPFDNWIGQKITFQSFLEIFRRTDMGNWHPLTMLSHMADWQCFGRRAGGHHWTNVWLHIFNAVLLFFFFYRTTEAFWRSAFAAMLFAVHPIHVESVAWISERKNVLSTFFWILTMLFYVRYASLPHWRKYLPVVLFFILGLMSKPVLVTLPFVLLLLDFWPLGRWRTTHDHIETGNIKMPKKGWKFLIIEKIPLLVLSAIFSCLTMIVQKNSGAMLNMQYWSIGQRIDNALYAYILYIRKLFWPFDLAVLYPFNHHIPWIYVLVAAILLVLITVRVGIAFRKFPYLLTGWLWYLGTLVPMIGIIQVGDQAMADRYAYVPFIGLFIMIAWGAGDGLQRKFSSKILAVFAILAVVFLTVTARHQVGYWKDTYTLFNRTLQVTENNSVAHSILAGELLAKNNIDEALVHCQKALVINPHNYNAWIRLARIYDLQNRTDRAVDALHRAIKADPHQLRAYDDLHKLLMEEGKTKEALQVYEQALNANRGNQEVYLRLANALAGQQNYKKAMDYYRGALNIDNNNPVAHSNLAVCFLKEGKMEDAIIHLREAIRLAPDYARAHYQLATLLKKKGLLQEAYDHYRKAVRLDPVYQQYGEFPDEKNVKK